MYVGLDSNNYFDGRMADTKTDEDMVEVENVDGLCTLDAAAWKYEDGVMVQDDERCAELQAATNSEDDEGDGVQAQVDEILTEIIPEIIDNL